MANVRKYRKEYKWANIVAMIRNQKLDPKICIQEFNDRLVIITGATSGIGYAAARKYAANGAEILCINRNAKKSKELCENLKSQYGIKCSYLLADFTKLTEVHDVAKKLFVLNRNIDVLIHNAGVYNTTRILTEDNLEMVFQTNYLSTFILNYYLKEKFINQNNGRILFVNSEAHRFTAWGLHMDDLNWDHHPYTGLQSYSSAKTAQLLSMLVLTDYFQGSQVTVNAMHPGNVKTNSGQNNGLIYKFLKKILIDRSARPLEFSAEALYYLGACADVANISGKFFNLTTVEEPAPPALDRDAARELWELSLELGGFK